MWAWNLGLNNTFYHEIIQNIQYNTKYTKDLKSYLNPPFKTGQWYEEDVKSKLNFSLIQNSRQMFPSSSSTGKCELNVYLVPYTSSSGSRPSCTLGKMSPNCFRYYNFVYFYFFRCELKQWTSRFKRYTRKYDDGLNNYN